VCGESCVPVDGTCTTSADCCSGSRCMIAPGSTSGTCGSDTPPPGTGGTGGGGTGGGGAGGTGGTGGTGGSSGQGGTGGTPQCAEYGQACTVSGDCCNQVPCTGGFCLIQIN
jgi:hypothetical protein